MTRYWIGYSPSSVLANRFHVKLMNPFFAACGGEELLGGLVVAMIKPWMAHPLGLVNKVPYGVIASDRRERGNLILRVAQRIEIATADKACLAMTVPMGFQHSIQGGER
jgi:hypothetical protein